MREMRLVMMNRPMVLPAMPIMMAMMHDRYVMPMVVMIVGSRGIGSGQSDYAQREKGCSQDLHFRLLGCRNKPPAGVRLLMGAF